MIVVRDIFRLRFGQSKEATALWKQGISLMQRLGHSWGTTRLLTDLVGEPYYTLVFESTFESLAQWEQASQTVRSNSEWRAWYQQVVPLTESGRREILTVVG